MMKTMKQITKKKSNDTDKGIVPQIHILGDVKIDTVNKLKAYERLLSEQMIEMKAETVVVECGSTTRTTRDSSQKTFRIHVKPYWSPRGAARFLQLVKERYFDGCALNRVIPEFLTQFGISRNYELRTKYLSDSIEDDASPPIGMDSPVPFRPGYMSYAGNGPDTRTNEIFIVMPDTPQSQLDYFGTHPWETPFGYVEAQHLNTVVSEWYSGYGDMPPWGNGPDPKTLYEEDGYKTYLPEQFPNMSYLHRCVILDDSDLELEFELEKLEDKKKEQQLEDNKNEKQMEDDKKQKQLEDNENEQLEDKKKNIDDTSSVNAAAAASTGTNEIKTEL